MSIGTYAIVSAREFNIDLMLNLLTYKKNSSKLWADRRKKFVVDELKKFHDHFYPVVDIRKNFELKMKNIINYINFIIRGYKLKHAFAFIVLVMAIVQISTTSKVNAVPTIKAESKVSGSLEGGVEMVEAFFGETPMDTASSIVENKEEFVSTRKAYPASLQVIQKHEDTILRKAEEYGVPADVAIGIGLLENGGSETAKSKAGALGIFQLMPSTARNLGLEVNKKMDERKNPEKNIDAGMRYLKRNYKRFGDWGMATWAYHAGEGNVTKAVKIYAKDEDNVKLKGLKDADEMREYIQDHNVTVHDLLSNSEVQKFTDKLNDDSSGYPYKVLATAKLFKKAKKS
jgi:hypothetical protein